VNSNTFPDFGKELQRPFAVAEQCYDCAELYDGCRAWPESKPFQCADYNRLPDVMPDDCGQVFPAARMQGRKEPRLRQETVAHNRGECRAPSPMPGGKQLARSRGGPRLCECGAVLFKGRRFCDSCRAQRRRQTMREYMRSRRAAPQESEDLSDMPLFAARRHATHARSGDLLLTGLPSGGARSQQTSV
jgi:hypothetical protein